LAHTEPHPDDVREGLLRGRAQALETLRGWVEGLLYGGGWRLSDPKSAVQDVVVKLLALAREGRIQQGTDFKSFVMKVARHAYTDIYRRERIRLSVEGGHAEAADEPAGESSPEDHLALAEDRRLLVYIVQGIGEGCRTLWRWIYTEGLSHDDVADRLEITPGNLRIRIHRCLKKARALVAAHVPPVGEQGGDHGA